MQTDDGDVSEEQAALNAALILGQRRAAILRAAVEVPARNAARERLYQDLLNGHKKRIATRVGLLLVAIALCTWWWIGHYAQNRELMAAQMDMNIWMSTSVINALVQFLVLSFLVWRIYRLTRMKIINAPIELTPDDPSQRHHSFRSGYIPPQRW